MQENGEANGEVKEPVDPAAPKKCDVIVLSGRKERCEAAVEALKVMDPELEFEDFYRNRNFWNFSYLFTPPPPLFLGSGSCDH